MVVQTSSHCDPCRKIRTEKRKIQTEKTESANGKYGKYGRNFKRRIGMKPPKTRYLTPQKTVRKKKVGTRQKSRYGQWPTQKIGRRTRYETREKVGTRDQKSAQTGKTKKLEILDCWFFFSVVLRLFALNTCKNISQSRKCKARKAGLNHHNL